MMERRMKRMMRYANDGIFSKGVSNGPQGSEDDQDKWSCWKYPAPWPTLPFSYQAERIQQRIPLQELPKRLIVHDPWDVLAVGYSTRYGLATADWTTKKYSTRVYKLALSPSAEEYRSHGAAEDKVQGDRNGDGALKENGFVLALPSAPLGPTSPSSVFVIHDPKPTGMQEAHLYLSPAKHCGRGNHSVVWFAEWEIPRSYLLPGSEGDEYVLCRECVVEDVVRILGGEARAAEKMVGEVGNAENMGAGEDHPVEKEPKGTGLLRCIRTTVKWQDPSREPTCSHIESSSSPKSAPPTVKVRVVAKLSVDGDVHLRREARNYQCFPQHFFEHWSGLNLLDEMEDPVPLGPIVPQFYGYYTPEGKDTDFYSSPIMLVEDVGKELAIPTLSMEERYVYIEF